MMAPTDEDRSVPTVYQRAGYSTNEMRPVFPDNPVATCNHLQEIAAVLLTLLQVSAVGEFGCKWLQLCSKWCKWLRVQLLRLFACDH